MFSSGRSARRRLLCSVPFAWNLRRSGGDGFAFCQRRIQATHCGFTALIQLS